MYHKIQIARPSFATSPIANRISIPPSFNPPLLYVLHRIALLPTIISFRHPISLRFRLQYRIARFSSRLSPLIFKYFKTFHILTQKYVLARKGINRNQKNKCAWCFRILTQINLWCKDTLLKCLNVYSGMWTHAFH